MSGLGYKPVGQFLLRPMNQYSVAKKKKKKQTCTFRKNARKEKIKEKDG